MQKVPKGLSLIQAKSSCAVWTSERCYQVRLNGFDMNLVELRDQDRSTNNPIIHLSRPSFFKNWAPSSSRGKFWVIFYR